MIKLAVNARLLQPNKLDGIGVYMHEILSRVVKSNPNIEFHFYFNKPPNPEFKYGDNVFFHQIFFPVRHMRMLSIWQNSLLPFAVKKLNPDALLCMDSLGMPVGTEVKTHLTLHDINFYHRPQDLPKGVRKFYQKNIPVYIKQASRIATVSEFSKKDISENFNLASNGIDVIYNAPKDIFKPLLETEVSSVRKKWTQGSPYFAYVGTIHPRKNVKGLIKAFFDYKRKYQGSEKLVIIGDAMWDDSELSVLKNDTLQKEVVLTGRVNDKVLAELIGGATALTYIPFFEGFGIPIVEAMASGIPVISSNVTSIPEVTQNAAVLLDPTNSESITESMRLIVFDDEYRNKLIYAGLKQAQEFSWEKSSDVFLHSVKEIL